MTRSSRTLIVIGGMALVSVLMLSMMARRYVKILDVQPMQGQQRESSATLPLPPATPEALADVDAFILVRRAVRAAMLGNVQPSGAAQLPRLRLARDQALQRHGVDRIEYLKVRSAYRSWRSGSPADDDLNDALEARRPLLREVDLGPHERFDL